MEVLERMPMSPDEELLIDSWFRWTSAVDKQIVPRNQLQTKIGCRMTCESREMSSNEETGQCEIEPTIVDALLLVSVLNALPALSAIKEYTIIHTNYGQVFGARRWLFTPSASFTVLNKKHVKQKQEWCCLKTFEKAFSAPCEDCFTRKWMHSNLSWNSKDAPEVCFALKSSFSFLSLRKVHIEDRNTRKFCFVVRCAFASTTKSKCGSKHLLSRRIFWTR